jgi:putative (di)nucleoside polyphosphate hydrolase
MKRETRTQTFRAGVGAIILGKRRNVLGLERRDIPGAWQFPQGGLDVGETPLEAVKREISEETGIKESNLQLVTEESPLLAYELPEEARTKKIGRGQVQYWFLFQFTGSDEAITLGDKKEFRAWKWMPMDELTSIVVSFKQPVYQKLTEFFSQQLRSRNDIK